MQQKESNTRTRSSTATTPAHDKNMCIWCLKEEDKKHLHRGGKLSIIQSESAWSTFKLHTAFRRQRNA